MDYNFVSRERFEAMVAAGDFLEWADVFGNLYGTSAVDTDRLLANGNDVVLVIDVQGARKVRSRGKAWRFRGEAKVNGQVVAEAEVSALIVDPDEYQKKA